MLTSVHPYVCKWQSCLRCQCSHWWWFWDWVTLTVPWQFLAYISETGHLSLFSCSSWELWICSHQTTWMSPMQLVPLCLSLTLHPFASHSKPTVLILLTACWLQLTSRYAWDPLRKCVVVLRCKSHRWPGLVQKLVVPDVPTAFGLRPSFVVGFV